MSPIHSMSLVEEAAQHGLAPGGSVCALRFTDGLGVRQLYRYLYLERALSVSAHVQREGLRCVVESEPWDGVAPVSFLKGEPSC